jgi:hypothetical protein
MLNATKAALAIALSASVTAAIPAEAATKRRPRIPALVNVDLRNVLNNLSVKLHLDRANVPVNAQIPITLAANVCGVSVNVLAISAANGKGHCTAKTASPKLAQVVQQQLAAGGNVGGGAQGGSTAGNGGGTGTGGAGNSGASGISGTSTAGGTGTAPTNQPPPKTP